MVIYFTLIKWCIAGGDVTALQNPPKIYVRDKVPKERDMLLPSPKGTL